MTIIEIILLVVGAIALLLAYQAHHNGVTIAAQAKADIATAKTDLTATVHSLETRIVALESKAAPVASQTPPAAPTAAT